MGGDYGALRLWSTILIGVGVIGVVFAIIEVLLRDVVRQQEKRILQTG